MLRSILYIILFSFVFFLTVYAGEKARLFMMPSYTLVIIAYMSLTTCLVVALIQKQRSRILFSQAYIASIVFKMLTGLGVMLVLIRLDPTGASGNAALFIISYIAFTAVEVAWLLKKVASQHK